MAGPGGIPDADWKKAQSYGKKHGVDPLLLVAIGIHETRWGKAGLGRQGLILGVGAYDSGPSMKWKGLDAQLNQGAKMLAQRGVRTVNDVAQGKAKFWATDPNWSAAVVKTYKQIAKNGFSTDIGSLFDRAKAAVDVPGAIQTATNQTLEQLRSAGISTAVFISGALLIIVGFTILFRAPLSRAAKTSLEIAQAGK